MDYIIQQEKELTECKAAAQSLQQQIIDMCHKAVIDSDALRRLRDRKVELQQHIADLSDQLFGNIIA